MIIILFYLIFLSLLSTFVLLVFAFNYYSGQISKYNKIFGNIAMLTIMTLFSIILLLIVQDKTYHFGGLIAVILFITPILFFGSFILISTLIWLILQKYFESLMMRIRALKQKILRWIENLDPITKDTFRKVNHIVIFVLLTLLWYLSYSFIVNYTGSSKGMIPENNNMLLIFFRIFSDSRNIGEILISLGWFYYVLFFFFYLLFILMIVNEYTRKSPRAVLPFNYISRILLREEEVAGYGSYVYFAIGHLFASFFCPPMVFFSILGMSSIGDLVASQVGMRKGKSKIACNVNKTWEGTIAAAITCFLICFFFVGIVWGVIFSCTFVIFDMITGKGFRNLDLSDNLLVPIGCALIYLVVRFIFNLDYHTIILGLF